MLAWSGTAWGSISSSAAIYRYKFIAAGGETSLSGADASSQTLTYLPGYEQVYLNGVLLVRTTDYTATTGSSIQTNIRTNTNTNTNTRTNKQTNTQTNKQTHTQTNKQTNTQTNKQSNKHKQTNKQAQKHTII